MRYHSNDRHRHAEENLHKPVPPALLLCGDEGRPPGIQHTGQATEYAHDISRHRNVAGGHDLDLDVTEPNPVPPRCRIIRGPEDGVGYVEEVQYQEPAYETAGWEVTILPVQNQRSDANEDREKCEQWDDHSLRIEREFGRAHHVGYVNGSRENGRIEALQSLQVGSPAYLTLENFG